MRWPQKGLRGNVQRERRRERRSDITEYKAELQDVGGGQQCQMSQKVLERKGVEICHQLWWCEVISDLCQSSFRKVVEAEAEWQGLKRFLARKFYLVTGSKNESKQQVQISLVTKCLERK